LADFEAILRRGHARQVFVAERRLRRDGLEIVAVVTRTQATEVLFHHVGEPQGDISDGFAALDAFGETLDRLRPPKLIDDVETTYQPVLQRPTTANGAGGPPDPERLRVITGAWRYQPPAPDTATSFEVDSRWHLK
jgi:hypothetical protein